MANATLSPKELSDLLARLDDAQRMMNAVRDQLIQAMAARRRPPNPQMKRRAPRVRPMGPSKLGSPPRGRSS